MGLISEWVEVILNSANIKHYENLGYEIPRTEKIYYKKNGQLSHRELTVSVGTKIKVKIEDVPIQSNIKVDCKCDCCGNLLIMTYQRYNQTNHNGNTYCIKCANTILHSGENNPRWNPNKTNDEREMQRRYPEYHIFVKTCLTRDNYTCQCCNKHYNNLEVHHLDGFDWCKEKRTDVTNGITLCETCHSNFHFKYGKGKNTKEQYMEWIGVAQLEIKDYKCELPTSRQIIDIEENQVYCSVREYANLHNIKNATQVYNVCNHKSIPVNYYTINNHHVLWYDEYLQMTDIQLKEYLKQSINKIFIPVICITTGKTFNNMADAARCYNANARCISLCCSGELMSSGKLFDGTKLQWMYLSDFEKLSKEEREKILDVKESENYGHTI